MHACMSGEAENMKHIILAKCSMEEKSQKKGYKNICNGNITMQIEILKNLKLI